ncbi:acyl-ACP thioesterase domain-containing protein [Pseudolactococcus plantarum]|uniref:Acyl-ACP thioesterase n=1 Tax=Pseudolactococcus plantarum TaxID=1365 RepID=A0A2A5RYH4_9LACT|nr:acyl-ACP thioesterase domain-containing protein [Lactococcus plantarum]PCS06307.1 acyl-ACP thioesterase [Lactococcus plantarum]HCN75512.1 acyl-[acyl-carrier-protein] thioesterase [Lactococcus sp.]
MLTYKKKYTVPYYESDANGNMKVPSLLNVALQLSGEHSFSIGVSDDWLKETYNYTWVVVEYAMEINRLPRFTETITVETFAKSYNKFFCYRDYVFYAENGEKLLTVSTTFVLLDIETRKVVRVLDEIVAPYKVDKVSKIIRGHKYQELSTSECIEKIYHVRFNDIDQNGHVNNSKYFDWMVDPLGFDFLSTYVPEKIYLKYVKEVLYGVDILSRVSRDGLVTTHEINATGNHAQAQINWRKK